MDPAQTGCCSAAGGWWLTTAANLIFTLHSFTAARSRAAVQESEEELPSSHTDSSTGGPYNHNTVMARIVN